MAQLHRNVDTSKTPAPTVATMEQLLRGAEASKASPTSSSSFRFGRSRSKNRDPEEDHGHHQKKSVLTKVKEKAKKLRYSLSKKKHRDSNVTTSWGEDEDEEDTEYFGSPMYESELAPEGYKEKARQHQRTTPVITEKHVLSSSFKASEHDRENPLSPSKSKRSTAHFSATTDQPPGPSKTMPETVAGRMTPAYGTGSGTVHYISPKFKSLNVSTPAELQISSSPPRARKASSALSSPKTSSDTSMAQRASSAPVTPQTLSLRGKNTSSRDQFWNKGVSVKEYLMNKFEPGEDEKALSQVISEAMSPAGRNPDDRGVIEKVREAVTSLLRNEEPSQDAVQTPATHTLSQIPVSTNAYEVGQEENQGRILQAK